MNAWTSFTNLFTPVPISTRIADQLHQARIDLLAAEAELETKAANVACLRNRIVRLINHSKEPTCTVTVSSPPWPAPSP